ncbi:MAG TPA: TlpA family protein disulfide reductase [candidate division Zixibacteria bacterium]|nr:TlpA family protein disulfide reductase [candidate division Zixibacteria bacterium]
MKFSSLIAFAVLIAFMMALFGACGKKSDGEASSAGDRSFPDFNATASDGKTYSAKDLSKGVTVAGFTVSWCAPCASELEALQEIQSEFANELSVFVFTYEDPSKFDSLSSALRLEFPILQADSALFKKLSIEAIPSRLLLQDAREVLRISGAPSFEEEEFRERIRQILGIRESA